MGGKGIASVQIKFKRCTTPSNVKPRSCYKSCDSQFVALFSVIRFYMFMQFYAVSFSIKTWFYETTNIFYLEYQTYFHKTVRCF